MRYLIFFLFLVFSFCLVEDASIKQLDAYSELSKAIEYKYKECGNKPDQPLIPPTKIDRNSLKICTLSILRMDCPFNEYPIFCYDMFFDIILK
jgi:hypothetical protein